eukprot:gene9518-14777_t
MSMFHRIANVLGLPPKRDLVFWFMVFTMATQVFRFSMAYIKLFVDGAPSQPVPGVPNAYVNVLGYVSYHTKRPAFAPSFIHLTCALIWTVGLLVHTVHNHRWSLRTHRRVGTVLVCNAWLAVVGGMGKAAMSQKRSIVRNYFYMVGALFIASSVASLVAVLVPRLRSVRVHKLCMRLSMESPVISSLWTEWLVLGLQAVLPLGVGETLGLLGGTGIAAAYCLVCYVQVFQPQRTVAALALAPAKHSYLQQRVRAASPRTMIAPPLHDNSQLPLYAWKLGARTSRPDKYGRLGLGLARCPSIPLAPH